jgi:hypothetical protein
MGYLGTNQDQVRWLLDSQGWTPLEDVRGPLALLYPCHMLRIAALAIPVARASVSRGFDQGREHRFWIGRGAGLRDSR